MSVAVRVFLGRSQEVAVARRWAAVLAAARGADVHDASLVASELVTNAIVHTRSGQPGGALTLAVTSGPGQVGIHVHDMGTSTGTLPTPRPAASADQDGLADGNRGLHIVATLGVGWGTHPAARCPASRPGDPATAAGGCCTWCTLACQPHQRGGQGTSDPAGMVSP